MVKLSKTALSNDSIKRGDRSESPSYNAINNFKNNWASRLLNPPDPPIHPAPYQGNFERYFTGRLMLITLLSQLTDEASMIYAGVPYIVRIFHINPALRVWIQADGFYQRGSVSNPSDSPDYP